MPRKKVDAKTQRRGRDFAQKIKDARDDLGLTQSQLAEKCRISLDTIRSIEGGRVLSPGVFLAADLIHALDGSLDEWLNTKPTKTSKK